MSSNDSSRIRRLSSASANSVLVMGVLVAALSLLLMPASRIYGQTTWNGSSNSNWNHNQNWNNNQPTATTAATFGTASIYAITLSANGNVGDMTFSNGVSNAYSFDLGNHTLNISGISGVGITNNNTLTQTFKNSSGTGIIALQGNQIWDAASGGLAFTTTDLNLNANALTIDGANNVSVSSTIAGTGNLTYSGSGTLTLNDAVANTYSGGTTISAGTVNIQNSASLGTGTATFSGNSTLQAGANNLSASNTVSIASGVTATVDTQTNNTTLSGVISGAGDLTKTGSGTLILSHTNTYTGNTTISTGTLQVSGSGDLGSGTYAGAIANSGTLEYSSSANQTLSGIISGTGALTKDTSSSSTLTLSGVNTFTGATNISKGTLTAGAVDVLKTSSGVTVASGATLNLNGFNQTITNLNNSGTLTYAGGETLTLAGGSNFLGGTMASAVGTLTIGLGTTLTFNASFTDTNLNIILAGGTLNLNGTTDVFGSLTVNAASTIDFASSPTNSRLTVTNVNDAGFQLSVTNWTDTQDYFYSTSQSPNTQGSLPLNQIVFTGFSGNSTKWLSSDKQITPVPEPATYGAIFTAAALGLFFWFRLKANAPRLVPVRIAVRF